MQEAKNKKINNKITAEKKQKNQIEDMSILRNAILGVLNNGIPPIPMRKFLIINMKTRNSNNIFRAGAYQIDETQIRKFKSMKPWLRT